MAKKIRQSVNRDMATKAKSMILTIWCGYLEKEVTVEVDTNYSVFGGISVRGHICECTCDYAVNFEFTCECGHKHEIRLYES